MSSRLPFNEIKMKIEVIEDINAFWENLGSRNKLYRVNIGKKVYKNMELTYRKTDNGEIFEFNERK